MTAEPRRPSPPSFSTASTKTPATTARWALAADLVVAADGGGRFLAAAGIVPDLLVGDFDSLDAAAVEDARTSGARVVRHPVRKDQTDGELAVDEALRAGAGDVVLAGALGALDHVLGHLALLGRVEAGGTPARLVSPGLTVRVLVAPAAVSLDARPGVRVSLAPLAGDAVVTLAGLDYPLRARPPPRRCVSWPGKRRGDDAGGCREWRRGGDDRGPRRARRGARGRRAGVLRRPAPSGGVGGSGLSDARLAGRLALAWAGVILAFAVLPTHAALSRTVGDRETFATEAGHFLEFAVLAWLVAWWLAARGGSATGGANGGEGATPGAEGSLRDAALAWAAVASYGAIIEVVQLPLSYRSAQWSDVAIDAAGALAGLLAFSCGRVWRARKGRRHSR